MWSAWTVLLTAGSWFVNVVSAAMIIRLDNSKNGLYHYSFLYMTKKNLPIKAKIIRHIIWFWVHNLVCDLSMTCRVPNIKVLWMTAASCRAQSILPPGLSLYPGLLSLCDFKLQSPLLALLYSTCAAASCFVLCASAVTPSENAALLPASELVAAKQNLCSLW